MRAGQFLVHSDELLPPHTGVTSSRSAQIGPSIFVVLIAVLLLQGHLFIRCFDQNVALHTNRTPQKALRGGIPDPYLEPLTRSWSHFVGVYCQKLTESSKNDF